MPAQLQEDTELIALSSHRRPQVFLLDPTYTTITCSQMPSIVYIQVDYRRRRPQFDEYPVLFIADEDPRPSRKSFFIHKDTVSQVDAQNFEISRRIARYSTAESSGRADAKRVRFQLPPEDGLTDRLERMRVGEPRRAPKARCTRCGQVLDADWSRSICGARSVTIGRW
jgi:hypothetical protein